MLGLITARSSDVGLALLDQVAAEGFWYYPTLVEVCHELPRDLQTGKDFVASSTEVSVPRLAASPRQGARSLSMHTMIMQLSQQRGMPSCSKVQQIIAGDATACSSRPLHAHLACIHRIAMREATG